jgi:hypothetical protein
VLMIQCNGCGTTAFADCICPTKGLDPSVAGQHHPECDFTDLGATVTCPPGSGCCQEPHSHDAAANACPGGHEKAACPAPAACPHWQLHTAALAVEGLKVPSGDCPGGHHGLGVKGCAVCRPVTISVPRSSVALTPTTGG